MEKLYRNLISESMSNLPSLASLKDSIVLLDNLVSLAMQRILVNNFTRLLLEIHMEEYVLNL